MTWMLGAGLALLVAAIAMSGWLLDRSIRQELQPLVEPWTPAIFRVTPYPCSRCRGSFKDGDVVYQRRGEIVHPRCLENTAPTGSVT